MVEPSLKKQRVRVAVLISGNGSNLQALLDNQGHSAYCPYEIALVFSNQSSAYGLERAKRANVPTLCFSHRSFDSKAAFENKILEELVRFDIEVVVLAGFMRILSPDFVKSYAKRILNIHPSLLPAFPGLNAVEQALAAQVKETGCTVHLVDEGVDTGPVLAQETVSVAAEDTSESLHQKIHEAEHRLYPAALSGYCLQEFLR